MGKDKKMPNEKKRDVNQINEIVDLLRCLAAIELWKAGISQADIGKRLGIATGSVNKYVKGIKKTTEPAEGR